MELLENVSLQPFNTFGIDARARYFVEATSEADVREALELGLKPLLLLGGGSNMLLKDNWPGLVLKNNIQGIEIVEENDASVLLKIGGGENWHKLVLWCLEKGYGGIENLSLIPGTVGAAPIQNIGAYGVELQDVFEKLEAIGLEDGSTHSFSKQDCRFGYRDSIFKRELEGKICISRVYLRLTKNNHQIHTDYGAIQEVLAARQVDNPDIRDISEAVIAIRSSKLPDPKELGNSGSFFKNPEITASAFETFHARFPEAPFYKIGEDRYKIPAGWLIEQAGWKGKKVGNTGSHKKQALVLVNYGNATGAEIWNLAMDIKKSVADRFQIDLQPEVNIIG
jgi:UDP-N-acetylmuramate dehydrogenase